TDFQADATVTIGGVTATDVTFVNSTEITATTPAGTAGQADVVVTNPDTQSDTLAGGFTYVAPAPTVTAISPDSGSTAGGTVVTITGTDFQANAAVAIGGVAATDVVFVNGTELTATTEARAAGTVDVVVTNPDTQIGTLTDGFTYVAPPTVASISPDNGPIAGGTVVTITGTDFQADAAVTIGGVAATDVTFVNSTSLTATTGARAAGTVDVVVTNPDTQIGTLSNGFTYVAPAPTVTAISPDSGSTAGGTVVTITGTDFQADAAVAIGGVAATGVTFVNSTELTATTEARAAGTVDVVVTNPDTQIGTLTDGFTYVAPPTVTAISPDSGPTAGGTVVTITGTDFQADATVTIGGVTATDVTFVNSTEITATTPAGTAGQADVVVTNPDTQSDTLAGGFTYN
ncbi:MAG TPA: IPT/TIG domain-containing protein, partial [Longimicrobiales bacterium]|nr:IPT/TIG domain-containing protein [Longimicrobiales bacterium]